MSTAVGAKPIRLGHAVIKVRDVERAEKFYGDLVGFELARKRPDAVFFRLGTDHHTLAVMRVGPDAPPPIKNQVGLYHLAFQVESLAALRDLYQRLTAAGTEIAGVVSHGNTDSFYCFDPEGNELEFYADKFPGRDWSGELMPSVPNQPLRLDD